LKGRLCLFPGAFLIYSAGACGCRGLPAASAGATDGSGGCRAAAPRCPAPVPGCQGTAGAAVPTRTGDTAVPGDCHSTVGTQRPAGVPGTAWRPLEGSPALAGAGWVPAPRPPSASPPVLRGRGWRRWASPRTGTLHLGQQQAVKRRVGCRCAPRAPAAVLTARGRRGHPRTPPVPKSQMCPRLSLMSRHPAAVAEILKLARLPKAVLRDPSPSASLGWRGRHRSAATAQLRSTLPPVPPGAASQSRAQGCRWLRWAVTACETRPVPAYQREQLVRVLDGNGDDRCHTKS